MALTRIRGTKPVRQRRTKQTADGAPTFRPDLLSIGAQYDLALHDKTGHTPMPGGALTAAALTVQQKNSQDIRRLVQPWQAESMGYYDLVPEHSFAARFMAQMLSKVRLFPARLDPETNEPEEITDGVEVELLARIQDRSGGRSELQRAYGSLKYLIGEVYMCAFPDEDRDEVWECLSPNEMRVQPQGIATRFRAPMLSGDQYIIGNDKATIAQYGGPLGPAFSQDGPDICLVYRMWRPSPAYTWLADCSAKANRIILEELVLSTYSVKAQLKSRLNTVGLLVVPEEMSFPSVGNDPDEDPQSDLLLARLTQAIGTAIGEPGAASAMVPIIAQVAGEFIKDIQHIRLNDTAGALAEISQRVENIERYGVGAELPPELFKSQADLNHWTGWLVDRQTFDNYGDPAAREMASDINASYFQPACREAGVKDWKTITIGVDPAEAINHPNRSKDAIDLFDRLLISGAVARDQLGYNDNDVMKQREKNEQAGLKIHDASLYLYDIPEVRANIEPEAGVVEGVPAEDASKPGEAAPGPPEQKTAPPATTGKPPAVPAAAPAVTASADPRVDQLQAACLAAVHRGREMAGSRLRSMISKRGRAAIWREDAIRDLANWDVAPALGHARVVELFGQEQAGALVDGTDVWLAAMLESMGVARVWAAEVGGLVQRHCAGTLYKPVADEIPAGLVRMLSRVHLPREQA